MKTCKSIISMLTVISLMSSLSLYANADAVDAEMWNEYENVVEYVDVQESDAIVSEEELLNQTLSYSNSATTSGWFSIASGDWIECRVYVDGISVSDVHIDWSSFRNKGKGYSTGDYKHKCKIVGTSTSTSNTVNYGNATTSRVTPTSSNNGTLTVYGYVY